MAFKIKQNDRRPLFVVALKDNFGEANEAAVNLTTATSVVFNMRDQNSAAVKISRGSMAITGTATGELTYTWGSADTNTVGSYYAEAEVLWNDGKPETFPNDGYWSIEITDDLA